MNKKEILYWRAGVYARANVPIQFFESVINEYDPDIWQMFNAIADIARRFDESNKESKSHAVQNDQ